MINIRKTAKGSPAVQNIATFLLLAVIITTGLSAPALAVWTCPSEAPEVHLNAEQREVQIIRTKSVTDLNKMHGAPLEANTAISGLGGGEIGLGGTAHFAIATRGGESCIWLKSLNATFYAYPAIHIARNYRRGSCEYAAILEHEMKHIRALVDFHSEYAAVFETELRLIAGRMFPRGPMPDSHIENAQEQMNKKIEAQINSFNERLLPALAQRQAGIDTPEEYAAVRARCGNWHGR